MNHRYRRVLLSTLLALVVGGGLRAVPRLPVPDRVAPALPEVLRTLEPSDVQLHGWLGARLDASMAHRLLVVDTAPLLAGFQHKPGAHPWIGEHVGKWLHAATLAWVYTGDAALKRKLDGVVHELLAAQEPDGYLGTYVKGKRFGLYEDAGWDVWSHNYNLLGLLAYYRYTGHEPALAACRRMGDLLIATFPAQRSINAAGEHRGMAATCVLEPMVQLYRLTGEARYLEFARYLRTADDEPGGPGIVRTLLERKDVSHTANAKAYEMLSNLVGLCEYARTTGDQRVLSAVLQAWVDIVARRLYLTGSTSTHEHFGTDHELPNGSEANVGETCVTVTWIQLNLHLLRLTGESAYADQIERAQYNHLTAAQHPAGADWCYYTPLEGKKQYDQGITCCHSSGPRALALSPTCAFLQGDGVLGVSTFETAQARFTLGDAVVTLAQESGFPREGRARLTVRTDRPARFALRWRVPDWAAPLRIDGRAYGPGWAELPAREWRDGDRVELAYTLGGAVAPGEYTNYARTAFTWGPFVLAADSVRNAKLAPLHELRVEPDRLPVPAPEGGPSLQFVAQARGPWDDVPRDLRLQPFADSGAAGETYRIWFRTDR